MLLLSNKTYSKSIKSDECKLCLWNHLPVLTSCLSPTDRVIPSLLHADSLIEVGCADSALSILEGVNLAELSTIQSRAKYALLLTQAKDKNYITHTDDSLIRVAVDYYDTSDDITYGQKLIIILDEFVKTEVILKELVR